MLYQIFFLLNFSVDFDFREGTLATLGKPRTLIYMLCISFVTSSRYWSYFSQLVVSMRNRDSGISENNLPLVPEAFLAPFPVAVSARYVGLQPTLPRKKTSGTQGKNNHKAKINNLRPHS